jgi:periplasmic divalent cation tolerance protein
VAAEVSGARAPLPRPAPVEPPAPDSLLLVFSNAPDEDTAQRIAETLVHERLAACVNITGPMQSVYRWHGAVERAQEFGLLIKTSASRFAEMAARLQALHPYEVPEIVALRPPMVLPAYAAWAIAETRKPLAGG